MGARVSHLGGQPGRQSELLKSGREEQYWVSWLPFFSSPCVLPPVSVHMCKPLIGAATSHHDRRSMSMMGKTSSQQRGVVVKVTPESMGIFLWDDLGAFLYFITWSKERSRKRGNAHATKPHERGRYTSDKIAGLNRWTRGCYEALGYKTQNLVVLALCGCSDSFCQWFYHHLDLGGRLIEHRQLTQPENNAFSDQC
jgi:hypothetical protein